MKLAITAHIRKLFDRYRVRITIGVLVSLLVHAFILSLQLGIPGLGLPGIALPWSERRVQTPELSVRIANLAGPPPIIARQAAPVPESNPPPKPQEAQQQPSDTQPLTDLPNARVKQNVQRSASNSSRVAKALKSTPAVAQPKRKNGTPPPEEQSVPAPARSQTELLALSDGRSSTFVVPAPDLDEWWRTVPKIEAVPTPAQPQEETAAPAIAMQTPKPSIKQAEEPAPAVQKPAEQESFERPDEALATEPAPAKTPDVAMELAARRQGEEIAQQEAARKLEEQEAAQLAKDLETRKREETRKLEADKAAQELAAQKLEEEQAARRAEEMAAKKLEDAKKQELADAERQAKEQEARRQAEEITRQQGAALALQKQMEAAQKQAEEIKRVEQAKAERQAMELAAQKQAEEVARQKAASLERQKQEEQLAAQKAQELAVRQKAESDAAAQRENARLAAAASAAAASAGGANGAGGTGKQSNGQNAGSLASNALGQIGKMGLLSVEPTSAVQADHPEENSRRRSIFGSIDHDIGLAMYIEGWRTKIERNGNLNYAQSSKEKAREDPVVTVAIRSDGSIEDIIINRSSGRADLDEAVRRILRVNARYSVFPASLARKYDVIEIRRVWSFDERLRVLEEVR